MILLYYNPPDRPPGKYWCLSKKSRVGVCARACWSAGAEWRPIDYGGNRGALAPGGFGGGSEH